MVVVHEMIVLFFIYAVHVVFGFMYCFEDFIPYPAIIHMMMFMGLAPQQRTGSVISFVYLILYFYLMILRYEYGWLLLHMQGSFLFPPEFYELGMLYTCPYFSEMMYIYEVEFRFPEFMYIFCKGKKLNAEMPLVKLLLQYGVDISKLLNYKYVLY